MIRSRRGSLVGIGSCPGSNSDRPHNRSGFTLIELTLAMVILVISLMSLSASTLRSHTLRRQNRERAMAHNAIRSTAERIQSFSVRQTELAPEAWAASITAALSPGGVIGTSFEATGLDADAEGRILLITDETTTDAELEIAVGMPRDLDGDAEIWNTDVSATARILPVVLTVEWEGVSGEMAIRHPFFVMGY